MSEIVPPGEHAAGNSASLPIPQPAHHIADETFAKELLDTATTLMADCTGTKDWLEQMTNIYSGNDPD